mmetsp:Transcript_39907/g.94829  ORF Transcript_39907/g.94829 Transcript_39907/m.94829 type:complete len:238 (-) Transcript_39907:1107-1820(-)
MQYLFFFLSQLLAAPHLHLNRPLAVWRSLCAHGSHARLAVRGHAAPCRGLRSASSRHSAALLMRHVHRLLRWHARGRSPPREPLVRHMVCLRWPQAGRAPGGMAANTSLVHQHWPALARWLLHLGSLRLQHPELVLPPCLLHDHGLLLRRHGRELPCLLWCHAAKQNLKLRLLLRSELPLVRSGNHRHLLALHHLLAGGNPLRLLHLLRTSPEQLLLPEQEGGLLGGGVHRQRHGLR